MITGIFGNLSSGKTLLAVAYIFEELKKDKEKKVFSNIWLNIPHEHLDFEKLIEQMIKNSTIFANSFLLADELHLLAESRRASSDLNVKFTRFATQLGKLDCTLIYTSQDFNQVDIRLRNLTDRLIFCRRVDKNKKPILDRRRILQQSIFIELIIVTKMFGGTVLNQKRGFFNPKKYFELYKTREIVMLDRDKYKITT